MASGNVGGVFRRRQLLHEGLPRGQVDARCRESIQVGRGLYASPDTEDDALYAMRCQAALTGGAALAGPSAAFLWELPMLERPSEVFLRDRSRGRYAPGVRVLYGEAEYIEHRGVRVTTPAWTVVDCARLMQARDALIIADAALHEGLCRYDDIRGAIKASRNTRAIGQARWVLAQADHLSESPGETWTRMLAHELGYRTISQFEVRDGDFVAYIDLMLDDGRTGLEFDGMLKYRKPSGDQSANAVLREKLRQGRLEELGYRILRVMWAQLSDPAALDRRIRAHGLRPSLPVRDPIPFTRRIR